MFQRFNKYKPFAKAMMLDFMAYKFQIFAFLLIDLVSIAFIFFLYFAVFSSSTGGIESTINGFSFEEMVVYTCYSQMLGATALQSMALYTITDEIKEGTISSSLIKPVSYRLRFTFMNIGNLLASTLFITLPMMIVIFSVFIPLGFIVVNNITVFILRIFLFFVAYLIASLLNDAISYFFGLLTFYTTSAFGINMLKNIVVGFLAGTIIPLAFFPSVMQEILQFLPFASMASNPILIIMGKNSLSSAVILMIIGIVWILILEGINHAFYNHAIKKVSIQGG